MRVQIDNVIHFVTSVTDMGDKLLLKTHDSGDVEIPIIKREDLEALVMQLLVNGHARIINSDKTSEAQI